MQTQPKHWKWMLRIAAIAAFTAAIFFRRNLSAEYSMFQLMGFFPNGPVAAPTDPAGWYWLLYSQPVYGLLQFNTFDLINYALAGLVVVGLYCAFRETRPGLMLAALLSGTTGVIIFLFTNPILEMWRLAHTWVMISATPTLEKLEAQGAGLLQVYDPGQPNPGWRALLALGLVTVSFLLFTLAMRGHPSFKRWVVVVGLIAHISLLTLYLIIPLAPDLIFLPHSFSAPFLLAWYLGVGAGLWRVASGELKKMVGNSET